MLMKLTLGDEENLDFEEKKSHPFNICSFSRDGLTRSVTLRFTNLNVSSGADAIKKFTPSLGIPS